MAAHIDSIDIQALLQRGTTAAPDRCLLSNASRALSGAELAKQAASAARALHEAGVRSGDRIALVLPDLVDRATVYWAAMQIGALPVLGAEDVAQLTHADAQWWVAAQAQLSTPAAQGVRALSVEDLLRAGASSPATLPWIAHDEASFDEDAPTAWVLSRAGASASRVDRASRSHRNIAYVGLLGSFAINGDSSQRIAAVGDVGATMFEALLYASVAGGAHLRHLQQSEVQTTHAQEVDTWVVEAKQAAPLIALLAALKPPSPSVLVTFDPESATREELFIPLTAALAGSVAVRALLVSNFDGIVAEYDFGDSQWRGFPGVAIGVAGAAPNDIAQHPGARGQLVLRSPQLGVRRAHGDRAAGFAADGWARLPLEAHLSENGFEIQAQSTVDELHGVIAPVTPSLEAAATGLDVCALIERSGRWRGDQPAIETEGQRMTYGQLLSKAESLSHVLVHDHGVEAGDRVAILGRNSVEFVTLYLAVNRLGAIFIPINFRLKTSEVAHVLRDSGAKLLVHSQEFAGIADEIRLGNASIRFAPTHAETTLERARRRDDGNTILPTPQRAVADEGRPASILYTAGTTGFPKGAVRSNRNVLWFSLLGVAPLVRTQRGQNHIVTTPMFHITGHEPSIFGALAGGGFTRILSEFKVDTVLDLVVQLGVSSLFVPPTIGFDLLDQVEQRGLRDSLRHFRFWSSASAPLPGVLLARIHQLLPWVEVTNTLGMTEAGSIARHVASAHAAHPPGCIGRATVAGEVAIVDPEGRKVPPGVPGEIVVRSPQVISAYWNNAGATAASIKGGWFHGGDIGVYDAAGNIEVKGRLKDMIITGGENVYAAEVENAILSMPQVKEAAVYGLPDPRWGESVTAAVVLREGASSVAEGDVVAHCRSRIAHYKSPKRVIFLDSLPRNPIGKVMKFALPQANDSMPESASA